MNEEGILYPSETDELDVENPDLDINLDQLAYIIFTSGSTGDPKGVMVPQRGLTNLCLFQKDQFGIKPGKRILQLAPLSFDASVWEIWMALGSGATLVFPPEKPLLSPRELLAVLKNEHINVITAMPSLLDVLGEHVDLRSELTDLETVIAASEFCRRSTAELWAEDRSFHNAYGPTETTVCATTGHWQSEKPGNPPIGLPLPGVSGYVLDQNLELTPKGVIGELCVSGVNLARGYSNRPDLTAERFIPNPFSKRGERLYRSGDLVYISEDGQLEFIGRSDRQVKLRGFRVELGEIEAAVLDHPSVINAAAVIQGVSPDERLVVFCTADGAVKESDLIALLRNRLPSYMLPSAVYILDSFPLTPSGKIDRHQLEKRSLVLAQPEPDSGNWGEFEKELVRIFNEVLNQQVSGVADAFFDLGGNSLHALRIVARIEERFACRLSISRFLELQSIDRIATYLETAIAPDEFEIRRIERTDKVVPLTEGQKGIWFISKLDGGGVHYHIPAMLSIEGSLNIPALQVSLALIANRHEPLRTIFIETDEAVLQQILPGFVPDLLFENGEEHAANNQDMWLQRIALEFTRQPFDHERGPLWRVKLIQIAADRHLLLFCFHHMIFDEWSLEIFLRELGSAYRSSVVLGYHDLAVLDARFSDYVFNQKAWLNTREAENQLRFWAGLLSALPKPLELPYDRQCPKHPSYLGGSVNSNLSSSLVNKLRQVSREEDVSVHSILLSCFALMLGRVSGQDEFVIGTPVSIRQPSQFEALIGYFLNTLALPVKTIMQTSVRECFKQIHQQIIQALEHRDYPFESLVQHLQTHNILGQQPLFRVMFNYYPAEQPTLELFETKTEWLSIEAGSSKFDLSLYISDRADKISLRFVYASDLFDHRTIDRLLNRYCELLAGILYKLDSPLNSVSLLNSKEAANILQQSYGPSCESETGVLIHQLLEVQEEHRPDAPAVYFRSKSLSYRELNQRANRLANYLRQLGVGNESRIAILLSRSPDLIISYIAVLKSGGAFIPLDPDYPKVRLSEMIADSHAELLITDNLTYGRFEGKINLPSIATVNLDRDNKQIAEQREDNLSLEISSDQIAGIYYTSGSTGRPKAVMNSHKGVVNYLRYLVDEYGFDHHTAALQITSNSFDASLRDFFLPLTVGGKLVLMTPEDVKNPQRFSTLIQENQINTVLSIVPTHLRTLVGSLNSIPHIDGLVQWLLISGEALYWEDLPLIKQFFGSSIKVVNQYGPTETTMTCAYFPIREGLERKGVIPIGKPIPNVIIYLLDKSLNLLPNNIPGDIYIGGVGVTRGYLGQPAETAAVFLPDPFSHFPGSRMYCSGDIGRYKDDGNLEFLGRKDLQVKIRGVRVEIGEVEAVIRSHPQVKDCGVICKKDDDQENRLIAYVVLHPGGILARQELERYLADRMPSNLLPGEILLRDHLPVNPNGKIDRGALALEETAVIPIQTSNRNARNEIESAIAAMWVELLGHDNFSLQDHFFMVGGHSLLAMRLMARLQNHFRIELPLSLFLETPTITALAQMVELLLAMTQKPVSVPEGYEVGDI